MNTTVNQKLQMKMINLASVSRKKKNENIPLKSPQMSKKIENFNVILMKGTATRRTVNKSEKIHTSLKEIENKCSKQSISKLRAPFHKGGHKNLHTEERLMTKSCEVLFECIKPCKDIRITKKPPETESKTLKGILKTNTVIYERTATRKIQFFRVTEETPSECFLWDERKTFIKSLPNDTPNFDIKQVEIQNETKLLTTHEGAANAIKQKTVSSEDFITNAFSLSPKN